MNARQKHSKGPNKAFREQQPNKPAPLPAAEELAFLYLTLILTGKDASIRFRR